MTQRGTVGFSFPWSGVRWCKGKIRRYKGKSACFRLGTGPRAAGQGSCTQPGLHGVAPSVRVEDQEVGLAEEAIACNGRSTPHPPAPTKGVKNHKEKGKEKGEEKGKEKGKE